MSKKPLRWGLLAAGSIAHAFANGLAQTDSGKAVAVGSRSLDKAKKFAKECNVPKAYGSYEELLADKEIDAVYIATPHPMHAEWVIKAADAGKHILCEKPAALNRPDVMTMIEAAQRNDVFFMEAFMYRCNPQTIKLVELIKSGAIGEVRLIQAGFAFDCGRDDLKGRLMNPELGGGGLLDVGCYTVSMARLIAGVSLGQDFAEPIEVNASGHIGTESRVDEWTIASLRFENNIMAQLVTGVQLNNENDVIIYGSKGTLRIPKPWLCNGGEAGQLKMSLCKYDSGKPEEIVIDVPKSVYGIEAETVAEYIDQRQAASPAMTWADTLGNMKVLDTWREKMGLEYPAESVKAYALPLDKNPLEVREGNKMKYGIIPGVIMVIPGGNGITPGGVTPRGHHGAPRGGTLPQVNKKISRLAIGMMDQATIAEATAMFDDFFARGANCFDTAYIYGGGLQEKLFGQWVRNRNLREEVVLIDKGAHTPECDPVSLRREFMESLDRLQMDYMDIYFMHRDNTEIPVGEFVDVLNELFDKGMVRAFGGSNWSKERFVEANEYAKKKGKQGFAALSNNFSLARMVEAPWGGCLASSEPDFRKWHEETQTPVFSWSSQAQGFFVPGRCQPSGDNDPDMTRCWGCDDNFKRQARCSEMAKKKNVSPMALSLAYVLHQSFPTFALIGPKQISETRSSFQALDIDLTPDEVKWLNLEA